ncbi:MAG: Gfo/Idh/MocA family oxidoreductase [Alphaproteobacteria bacterium]|nr:Gfo/Idh/MocA family oxidoreductase [Alphaproteobacteria bacterium]
MTTTPGDGPPIRLGIAGLGLAGAMMIRAAVIHPRVVLAAGADPLPRPREAFARDFGARVYAGFEALCADSEVDAIYIASPHEYHADQAVKALAAGKHVLVEKPLALTLADCDTVIAAAEAAKTHLIVGHTHAFDPSIRAIADLVRGGTLGRLGMILAFNYSDFLYRPRRPEELDTSRGGGITFNQVTHQIEIARLIAGGMVRSVRANVGVLDPSRPSEGNCTAFLEFENGAAASLTYSAYDFFDSDEFHGWVAEGGADKPAGRHGLTRQGLLAAPGTEPDRQKDLGYGGRRLPPEQPHLPHFGTVIVTCAKGDVRLSSNGLLVYGLDGLSEVPVPRGLGRPGHGDALDALWAAMREGRRSSHDARWGKATLEVGLAVLQSARERREIVLAPQVPVF